MKSNSYDDNTVNKNRKVLWKRKGDIKSLIGYDRKEAINYLNCDTFLWFAPTVKFPIDGFGLFEPSRLSVPPFLLDPARICSFASLLYASGFTLRLDRRSGK